MSRVTNAPRRPYNPVVSDARSIDALGRRLFWAVSRLAFALYRWAPVFGALRSSVGIIRRGPAYLAIDRADGRGLGLPGGLARPRETDEDTLKREIAEETGLHVVSCEFAFRCPVTEPIPASLAVFRVKAEGEIRGSWEGQPKWVALAELQQGITASQRPIVEQVARWTS